MNDVPSHPERRDSERFDSRLPLYVDGHRASLTDLSRTGIGFVTGEPPEPGSKVTIGMRYLPDDRHPAPSEAEVMHVKEDGKGRFCVGARLLKPARS